MAELTKELRELIFGSPWGDVFPKKNPPNSLAIDGRTVALRTLRQYITNLVFFRPMARGQPPQAFSIKPENFHIEWPDHEVDWVSPSVAVIPSRADYVSIGLTSYVEESTRDKYERGTVVQWQSEYTETINLELWSGTKAERRSMLAGIETALTPTEQMYGLRFRMPDYFNELVCFTLMRREIKDEPTSAKGRRRVQVEIEMRFNVVALVRYVPLVPTLVVNVDSDEFGVEVAVTDED